MNFETFTLLVLTVVHICFFVGILEAEKRSNK